MFLIYNNSVFAFYLSLLHFVEFSSMKWLKAYLPNMKVIITFGKQKSKDNLAVFFHLWKKKNGMDC